MASASIVATASASGVEAPTDEHAAPLVRKRKARTVATDKSKSCKFQNNFYLITMHQRNGLGVVTQNGWCIDVVAVQDKLHVHW